MERDSRIPRLNDAEAAPLAAQALTLCSQREAHQLVDEYIASQ